MSLTVKYYGLDEVLEYFDKYAKQPYFSIWDKSQPLVQYSGDSFDEAKEIITDEINLCKKRNYENPLCIKLHTEKAKVYTSTNKDYNSSAIFLCYDSAIGSALMPMQQNNNQSTIMLLNEINALKSEISALKTEKIEEEEEEEDYQDSSMSFINGVNQALEHPIIAGLLNKLINGKNVSLAGVNSNLDLDDCIKTLFDKGVTVEHLRKLADMPKSKISMLLSML
jgi:hypothetical protein